MESWSKRKTLFFGFHCLCKHLLVSFYLPGGDLWWHLFNCPLVAADFLPSSPCLAQTQEWIYSWNFPFCSANSWTATCARRSNGGSTPLTHANWVSHWFICWSPFFYAKQRVTFSTPRGQLVLSTFPQAEFSSGKLSQVFVAEYSIKRTAELKKNKQCDSQKAKYFPLETLSFRTLVTRVGRLQPPPPQRESAVAAQLSPTLT